MFITKIAKRLHRGEKGFTLIELLVVLAILAVIVGLVVPNFFGVMDGADAVQIQGQHEKMREAVFLYHEDTGQWPREVSWYPDDNATQLWRQGGVANWDGPYIDRPILQQNRWGGGWGVCSQWLDVTGQVAPWTILVHNGVPHHVALAVDSAMDDGLHASGAVQFAGNWTHFPDTPPDGHNVLIIVIAKQ